MSDSKDNSEPDNTQTDEPKGPPPAALPLHLSDFTTDPETGERRMLRSQDIPFSVLCDRFERCLSIGGKASARDRFQTVWTPQLTRLWHNGDDIFPYVRLIIPEMDAERRSYGIREARLPEEVITACGLDHGNPLASELRAWKRGSVRGEVAGDVAFACAKLLARLQLVPGGCSLTVHDVNVELNRLVAIQTARFRSSGKKEAKTKGRAAEQRRVRERLWKDLLAFKLPAREAMWFFRIVLRDLRIGVSGEGFLRRMHMGARDLYDSTASLRVVCRSARRLLEGYAASVSPGTPCKPMLCAKICEPEPEKVVVARAGGAPFWVEAKLDGERRLVHRTAEGEVRCFTRHAMRCAIDEEVLRDSIRALGARGLILDGEIVARRSDGTDLAFGHTRTVALAELARAERGPEMSRADDSEDEEESEGEEGTFSSSSRKRPRTGRGRKSVDVGSVSPDRSSADPVWSQRSSVPRSQRLAPSQHTNEYGRVEAAQQSERVRELVEQNDVRLVYCVFDVLWCGGHDFPGLPQGELVRVPLHVRRELLTALVSGLPPEHARRIELVPVKEVDAALPVAEQRAAVRTAFEEAMARGAEGLVVKMARSLYQLNVRKPDWVKLKPEYFAGAARTLDLVIVGASLPDGVRRRGHFSTLLVAAVRRRHGRDARARGGIVAEEARGEEEELDYVPVARVGSGYTDHQLSVMRHRLIPLMVPYEVAMSNPETVKSAASGNIIADPDFHWDPKNRPDYIIRDPELSMVVTVLAAEVRATTQYASGLTLRFPRVSAVRHDRHPREAESLGTLQEIMRSGGQLVQSADKTKRAGTKRARPRARAAAAAAAARLAPQFRAGKITMSTARTGPLRGLCIAVSPALAESRSLLDPEERSELVRVWRALGGGENDEPTSDRTALEDIARALGARVTNGYKRGRTNVVLAPQAWGRRIPPTLSLRLQTGAEGIDWLTPRWLLLVHQSQRRLPPLPGLALLSPKHGPLLSQESLEQLRPALDTRGEPIHGCTALLSAAPNPTASTDSTSTHLSTPVSSEVLARATTLAVTLGASADHVLFDSARNRGVAVGDHEVESAIQRWNRREPFRHALVDWQNNLHDSNPVGYQRYLPPSSSSFSPIVTGAAASAVLAARTRPLRGAPLSGGYPCVIALASVFDVEDQDQDLSRPPPEEVLVRALTIPSDDTPPHHPLSLAIRQARRLGASFRTTFSTDISHILVQSLDEPIPADRPTWVKPITPKWVQACFDQSRWIPEDPSEL